ncbi:Hypothetical predicted protein, partial [Pelobates cultripes]
MVHNQPDMGRGRKSNQGSAVAPILQSRKEEGPTRVEEGNDYDTDSAASDTNHGATTALTSEDLRHLLREIKINMATEFTKHLTSINEGLSDLAQCATDMEEWMDQATSRSTAHENAIEELRDQ